MLKYGDLNECKRDYQIAFAWFFLTFNNLSQQSRYWFFYIPGESGLKVVHLMHTSEYPQLTFSLIDDGNCVVVQNGFDLLMAKLKAFFTPRKGGKTDVSKLIFLLLVRYCVVACFVYCWLVVDTYWLILTWSIELGESTSRLPVLTPVGARLGLGT